MMWRPLLPQPPSGMLSPVLCDCGRVYDTAKVTVIARYADCSVWRSPCCDRINDDRPRGWGDRHYTELRRGT